MPQQHKLTFAFLFIAATIACLSLAGCKPGSGTKVEPDPGVPDDDAALGGDIQREAASGDVVIDGGLEAVDWRSLVGQQVTIKGDLVIVDTYDLGRRGQVTVARDRLFVPTSRIDPNDSSPEGTSFEGGSNVAEVVEMQGYNTNATIILDDGIAEQNVYPPPLFPEIGKSYPTVRLGSRIRGFTGRVMEKNRKLVLVPNDPLAWKPVERPERPNLGDATITVASFNVLNYFTTIDNRTNDARGADSTSEFQRQQAKLVSAISALKADVIGLMELENNVAAEQRLVEALNANFGDDVYKGCGIPDGFRETPGGDNAIRVGIIYRDDRVAPVGNVSMIDDKAFSVARTPLVQTFQPVGDGKPFTLIVNHFKSKGGGDDADAENKNKGDGQGAFNAARRAQALAICDAIEAMNDGDTPPRVLVAGDLNAYEQEDPIDAMRAKGLVDLLNRPGFTSSAGGKNASYSYVYYGQCGSLDHALATESLADDVTGVAVWHINADEPRFLDYNEEYNPRPVYTPDPFRSSDHDPVLIGIGG